MKRLSTFSRSLYVANALLAFNAITAIGTGIWYLITDSCTDGCLYLGYFLCGWGLLGLVSAIFLFKKFQWAIWTGSLFFLLQTLSIISKEFYYFLDVGLRFNITISGKNSAVSFNVLAITVIIILIGSFVREAQLEAE